MEKVLKNGKIFISAWQWKIIDKAGCTLIGLGFDQSTLDQIALD